MASSWILSPRSNSKYASILLSVGNTYTHVLCGYPRLRLEELLQKDTPAAASTGAQQAGGKAAEHAKTVPHTNLPRSSFVHQKTAINLVQFRQENKDLPLSDDKVEDLILKTIVGVPHAHEDDVSS